MNGHGVGRVKAREKSRRESTVLHRGPLVAEPHDRLRGILRIWEAHAHVPVEESDRVVVRAHDEHEPGEPAAFPAQGRRYGFTRPFVQSRHARASRSLCGEKSKVRERAPDGVGMRAVVVFVVKRFFFDHPPHRPDKRPQLTAHPLAKRRADFSASPDRGRTPYMLRAAFLRFLSRFPGCFERFGGRVGVVHEPREPSYGRSRPVAAGDRQKRPAKAKRSVFVGEVRIDRPRPHGGELIGVAEHDHAGALGVDLGEKARGESHVDHRSFVDDEDVRLHGGRRARTRGARNGHREPLVNRVLADAALEVGGADQGARLPRR